MKKFLKTLKKHGVSVRHETTEESIVVREIIEGYELEFILKYNVHIKNYLPATYDQPEECDFEFENTGHEEIALYKDEEMIELTQEELNSIDAILESILY